MTRELYKIFKPYIVKRKGGYCALLIPLSELDELIEKISALQQAREEMEKAKNE